MGVSARTEKLPVSRGWWRLSAGVILVVAATVGFGFYWPLRQGNQLLAAGYTKTRQEVDELRAQLDRTQATLKETAAERASLLAAQAARDAMANQRKAPLERVMASLNPQAKSAIEMQKLRLSQHSEKLYVELLSPALLGRQGDNLSTSGRMLLCPILTAAGKVGTMMTTIRTFAPVMRSPVPRGSTRWTNSSQIAMAIAETLVARCGIAPEALTIATSVALEENQLPRLELAFRSESEAP